MNRPCIKCGALIASGSRCTECKLPSAPKNRPRDHPHANPAAWKRLSKAVRKAQPFCLDCGRTDELHADHIIAVSERPDLALERLNITVRCPTCNGRRGSKCTDAERAAVLAAIAERKQRQQAYYLRENAGR